MATKNEYHPDTVSHPGMMLEEKLEELDMPVKEFAVRTGKPEQTIIKVLKGKSSITPDMAIQFEKVLGIPAKGWLRHDRAYQEYNARIKYRQAIKNAIDWMRRFPYRDMVKCGWVPDTRKPEERVENLFSFFGISSADAWADYFMEGKLKVSFRLSLKSAQNPEALSVWLRHGEITAPKMEAAPYQPDTFKSALKDLKSLIHTPEDPAFFKKLQKICADAGVKVIYSPKTEGAPVSGATRFIGDHPVIQLSNRYKWHDTFWFNFFHEAGHILKHGRKEVFLEGVDYDDADQKKEEEANTFAARHLLPGKALANLIASGTITEESILKAAEEADTHPGIVVGRLQHDKVIGHNQFNGLRVRLDLDKMEKL